MLRGFRASREGMSCSSKDTRSDPSGKFKGDFSSRPDRYTTPERQREEQQLLEQQKLSPLEYIKTLPELLEFIPDKDDRQMIIDAAQRARKAFNPAEKRKRKEPQELVDFVKISYHVHPHKRKNGMLYEFESKEHPENYASIRIIDQKNKSVMTSERAFREYKDEVYFSDLQRYACISKDGREKSIDEYHSKNINNDNTKKILKILYSVNLILNKNQVTDGNLNLTRESAAFMPFLGTDVNISKVFLAKDLGLSIQSATIQNIGEKKIHLQMKFVPAQ